MKFKKNQATLNLETMTKGTGALRRFFSSRRAKYGSLAALFTVSVLVVALLFNVLLTSLSENLPLAVDVSASSFFTLSDASRALIEGAMPEESVEVRVRFMMPEDRLEANEYYNMTLSCARTYAQAFENVTVDFVDIVTRPSEVAEYRRLGFDINSTSVVVDCLAKGRVKTFGIESCFLTREGEDRYYGFDGETQLTAAIMAVCRDTTPVVTFTQGHGEVVPPSLERMFVTAGYSVRRTNLAIDELDPETQILVISGPQTDFLGLEHGEQNEMEVLVDYLNRFRDVMVFLSPATQPLPELDALLHEWGIEVTRGTSLRDDTQSVAGSGGANLIASYAGEAYLTEGSYYTLGSALHKNLSTQQSAPMTLLADAAPLSILYTNTDGQDGPRSVDSVLATSENAYLEAADGTRQTGSFPLMALSSLSGYQNDDLVYSHMLVCGSTAFSDPTLTGDSYSGNSEILYTAMTLMSKEAAPEGIELKRLDDTTLSAPEGYAKTVLTLSMTVLPAVVFALGGVVYLRRRHK